MQSIPEKYPANLRILHWLMAVMIVGMLVSGLMMGDLPKGEPLRDKVYFLHKSFGVTVLILALLRLLIRLFSTIPPLSEMIPAIERTLALLGHWVLYFFMIAIPVSGIVMSNAYGFGVPFFGLELPHVMGVDKDIGRFARKAHEYMAFAFIGLVGLHVLGALKHAVKERINLFKRII